MNSTESPFCRRFADRVALVTGALGGIGAAPAAQALGTDGYVARRLGLEREEHRASVAAVSGQMFEVNGGAR